MSEKAKHYSPMEERIHVWSHLAGVLFTPAALYCVFHSTSLQSRPGALAGAVIYVLSLLLMFGCSCTYHLIREPEKKALFRRFDHCAIYILIAATYTPLLAGGWGGPRSHCYLGIIWGVALTGVVLKAIFGARFHWVHVILYLVLGWALLWFFRPVAESVSREGLRWLTIGGVTYTVGVLLYIARFPGAHAVWHFFVLAGAFFQFIGNLNL